MIYIFWSYFIRGYTHIKLFYLPGDLSFLYPFYFQPFQSLCFIRFLVTNFLKTDLITCLFTNAFTPLHLLLLFLVHRDLDSIIIFKFIVSPLYSILFAISLLGGTEGEISWNLFCETSKTQSVIDSSSLFIVVPLWKPIYTHT